MLRWQCQSGAGGGTAIIPPGSQLTMISCASDSVETEIRIDMFDPIIVPANHNFTIGAQELGYLWVVCIDRTGKCQGQPQCDRYPGDKQISIAFTAANEPGGPLSWFVAWIGC